MRGSSSQEGLRSQEKSRAEESSAAEAWSWLRGPTKKAVSGFGACSPASFPKQMNFMDSYCGPV